MIPFPHIWKTDPATGELRCYRHRPDGEPSTLAEAIAGRIRKTVAHAAVSGVMIAGAQTRLHGYGAIDGTGAAEILEKAALKHAAHADFLCEVEDRLLAIIGQWPNGEPADYTAAKAESRRRLKERFPHADLSLIDGGD